MLARTSGNRVGDGDEAHAIEKPGNTHSLAAPHSAFDLDAHQDARPGLLGHATNAHGRPTDNHHLAGHRANLIGITGHSATGTPRRRAAQEAGHEGLAVIGQDRFRVKLETLHRM